MTRPYQWHPESQERTNLQRALVTRVPPNPLVVGWRWRYEITLLSGFVAGLAFAVISFGAVPTIITAVVTVVTTLSFPAARRSAIDRAWCIITPHRVRVGCAEGLIYSSRGKIPIILWTSHQPFGERVVLWCRAGTSVQDFVCARAVLTAACWAQDVEIFFDTQRMHLVTLDIRRRPLDLGGGGLDDEFPRDPPAQPFTQIDDQGASPEVPQ
jgi:hypothetical protein